MLGSRCSVRLIENQEPNGVMKIIKYVFGVLLVPPAIGFSKTFYTELSQSPFIGGKLHLFVWGIILYMLMHILIYKPNFFYTFGHEAVHILATWLCGGHVTSFNVSGSGGSVTTSKTNFFIELSPYFIPLYTIILIILIPFLKHRVEEPNIIPFYIFSLGFTLGMHLIMTAESLKIRQTDILRSGYVFSYLVIYIANIIIIFLVLSFFVKGLVIKTLFTKGLKYSGIIYKAAVTRLF